PDRRHGLSAAHRGRGPRALLALPARPPAGGRTGGRRELQPGAARGQGRPRAAADGGAAVSAAGSGALEVLYRDEALAVVNKPAGLMVHDSALARGESDFAADRLREQFGRPIHLVHRLDRATSGCLLLAFERETAAALGRQFMSREVE